MSEAEVGFPTNADLWRALCVAIALLLVAVLTPVLSVYLPRIEGQSLNLWFQRSGSLATILALIAEVAIVRAKLSITPAGFGWPGVNEQRRRFLPLLGRVEWAVLVTTLGGTLIWGYGDLFI
jgi:hypothetical protein